MRLISAIHRWAGGLIGLLLALLGLTGAILVWEGEWVTLPGASDAVVEDTPSIAAVIDQAVAEQELRYITLASEEIGLHQLIFADGGGAYVRQDGSVVDRWTTQWERPELWLFDLHHHLFAGDIGEFITGVAGIAGLLFVITGAILWWRSRRSFRLRLFPTRFAPGPIVSHHRDLGAVMMPMLLLSMLTGVLMLFAPLRSALLGAEQRPRIAAESPKLNSHAELLAYAKALFPEAALRRITIPRLAGDPILIRLRQPFEWTPNGRTQISVSGDGRVTVEDPARANRSAFLSEKAYPIHSAKVGGLAWKATMTLSGLTLTLLGSLAVWSFWLRRFSKRIQRHQRPQFQGVAS